MRIKTLLSLCITAVLAVGLSGCVYRDYGYRGGGHHDGGSDRRGWDGGHGWDRDRGHGDWGGGHDWHR